MKKITLFSLIFFLFFQVSFSQNIVDTKYNEAKEAYIQGDFETCALKIKEIKPLYKTVPPKVLYLEIMAKSAIIKKDPLDDFEIIDETRKQTSKYLKANVSRKNENYKNIQNVSNELNTYPKDLASFQALKKEKELEELERIKQEEKEAAEEKARIERVALETKIMLDKEELSKKARLEAEKIQKEVDAIEAKKNREANEKAYAESEKQAERDREKQEKEERHKLKSFSSIGIQSGEIAKYGLLYERGGKKFIGFHISARTSLTSEEDILNGKVIENKTELELGPNFKIFKRLYFNIGIGYGYYDRIINNDYAGEVNLEKTGYSVATTGLMFRISRTININGGASFMDIDKDLYKPEITFGISFNLKGKYSY